jgi:hypothetical protein
MNELSEAQLNELDAHNVYLRSLKHSGYSMTRCCFELVRKVPGLTRVKVAHDLSLLGHAKNSVASMLSQYVKAGLMNEDGYGGLSVTTQEYKAPKRVVKVSLPQKVKIQAAKRIKDLPGTEKPEEVVEVPCSHKLTAEYVMDNISIAEGKKLFTLLSNVF